MSYIKLDRKISDWEWFTDGNMVKLWIYLLTHANYKDTSFQGHELKSGDVIVGRKILAERLKMSERSVRTCLEKLKKTKEVTIKTTNKYSIITIVKWAEYQCLDDDTDQQAVTPTTNKRPTNDQQTTTYKKYKKLRNKESNKYIVLENRSEEFKKAFLEFADMRSRIKKPLTESMAEKTIKKLEKLSTDEKEQIQILDQSTYNYWQGVFPLGHTTAREKKPEERYRMDF